MTQAEYLKQIDSVIAQGPYTDTWQSLSAHTTPKWYQNDKFGIFVHWGIYSVPGFGNEWYSRNMYNSTHPEFEHHIKTYGKHKDFGYKDFIPMFTAEKFDAKAWADLFKESGARFVMPVCEHHDGFAMYRTDFNRWNALDMGPKRDVIGEVKAAVEERGMTFCGSTHRAEHFFFMNTGRTCESDVGDERYMDFYGPAVNEPAYDRDNIFKTTEDTYAPGATEEWLTDWMVRTCELVDRYQPNTLYFDWWIHNYTFKPYLRKIAAYYYNRAAEWGREVTIIYKHEAFPYGTATFDVERGALREISPVAWQCDTAIGKKSWGYRFDNEYKTPRQIVTDLIDVVSKNGCMLLNVGPRGDGSITDEETAILKQIGAWMKLNGEGIYGTTFWKRFGEGEVNNEEGFFKDYDEKAYTAADWRFTYKNGCVYAFQMRPDGNDAVIKCFKKHEVHDFLVSSVTLLSTGEALRFERTQDGMKIFATPSFDSHMPLCFKIELN